MAKTGTITVSVYNDMGEAEAMTYVESMVRKFTLEDEKTGSQHVGYSWIDGDNVRTAAGSVRRTKSGNLAVTIERRGEIAGD